MVPSIMLTHLISQFLMPCAYILNFSVENDRLLMDPANTANAYLLLPCLLSLRRRKVLTREQYSLAHNMRILHDPWYPGIFL